MTDNTYMTIASIIAKESKCERAKVGAVIVKNKRIVATGYNGQASGVDNCCEESVNNVLTTLPTVIHAELNAILNATTEDLNGATLYVTMSPCLHCASLIKQKGISKVVYGKMYRDIESIKWLKENGVECIRKSISKHPVIYVLNTKGKLIKIESQPIFEIPDDLLYLTPKNYLE